MLRIPTRTRIRWHLQWHPPWQPSLRSANPSPLHTSEDYVHLQRHHVWRQPSLGSANPDPYTHQTTPPTTSRETAPPQRIHKICEPSPPKAIWGKKTKRTCHHLRVSVTQVTPMTRCCGSQPLSVNFTSEVRLKELLVACHLFDL